MSQDPNEVERNESLGYSLKWLIFGRLVAATLFLLASAMWSRVGTGGLERTILSGTLPIFFAVLILCTLYIIAVRFARHLELQARIQFLLDVILVTWLVWATGDINSPYAAAYIIVISAASIYLGPRGALITSVGCVAAFTGITLATSAGLVPAYISPRAETLTAKAIQAIGLNDIAFLVVGLLSARLAARQSHSDVQLIAATQTLASLRALHERIVESIRSGVITTDLEGRIYTFNAAAEEITGYKSPNVLGQNVSIFFGELAERVDESMSAAAAGEPSPRFEADCLTSDGLRLRLGFSIFPLFAESGETTGRVITFQDLTEVRALEETSRRQDRLAAVGRVAAGIAHEIRNPLASMRGSIQVLRSDMDGNSSQAQLMGIILRESDRLNQIITDFLTYARPRQVTPSTIDLREPLSETFMLLRHSPEIRPGHLLEEDLPEEPAVVNADASQLKQVFWNLARNALHAMPDGGTLRAELSRPDAKRWRITFTDTGRGMSPEQVEHLFEPFSSRTGGTGLGLSIVYQIIRDHGGTINVRSREGQGTTITVELRGSS
jgi:two-component system sensor histidine kinase PilS (NtrC family)